MSHKFPVGQLVVCTRVNNDKYSFMVGAVGEVVLQLSGIAALLTESDYAVDFPMLRSVPCPGCGKVHGQEPYAMSENELKALDDPDKDTATPTDQDVEEPMFGFAGV